MRRFLEPIALPALAACHSGRPAPPTQPAPVTLRPAIPPSVVPPSGSIRCSGPAALDVTPDASDETALGLLSLRGLSSFAVGNEFACGAQLDGRVTCWGNVSRLRGGGPRTRTQLTSGYWSAKSIVAGESFACFIRADNRVLCFGTEPSMGLPSRPRPLTGLGEPRVVKGAFRPLTATTLAAGAHHACALGVSGLTCWGKNDHAQLGDGTTRDRAEAEIVKLP